MLKPQGRKTVDESLPGRYVPRMDWLWPIYQEYVTRLAESGQVQSSDLGNAFLEILANSIATLYVMEPIGDTIRFRAMGQWPIPDVPGLLADPNAFIADRYGGGKYKINFHHAQSFVCTHNFRTYGEERWREMQEIECD